MGGHGAVLSRHSWGRIVGSAARHEVHSWLFAGAAQGQRPQLVACQLQSLWDALLRVVWPGGGLRLRLWLVLVLVLVLEIC